MSLISVWKYTLVWLNYASKNDLNKWNKVVIQSDDHWHDLKCQNNINFKGAWVKVYREKGKRKGGMYPLLWFLHNIVEFQHCVRRRIDEDVGQRVLVVVHLVWKKKTGETFRAALSPPSSSFIIQYISHEMSPPTAENMSLPPFQPLSEDKGKVTHVQYQSEWRERFFTAW